MAPNTADRVIVVGGGPVGLVAALCLATEGIKVLVIEAGQNVAEDLRASTFHPPTLDALARYGLTDTLIAEGRLCPLWQFRDRAAGAIATFDLAALHDDTAFPYRLQCEQWKLTRLLQARLAAMPEVELCFHTEATEVTQTAGMVQLTVSRDGQRSVVEGRYLVAADGARSAMRRAVGVAFDGMTLPEVFLSLSTDFPFHEAMPDLAEVAYVADPDEWLTLLRTPDLWRVLFPTAIGETDAQMMAPARIEQRLQAVCPSATPFQVVHRTAYRVHQRVARAYVHGRVVLAGDAAHLNNPLGGMGMNGGIHDAINLAEKLVSIWRSADAALLGRYERQRRHVAIETVQAQAARNHEILSARDPAQREAHYRALRATADDPARHRDYLLRSSLIHSLRESEAIA